MITLLVRRMSTWIVRISSKNKVATQNWNNLLADALVHSNVTWDKNYKNQIKIGDTLGFIVGEINTPRIHFYNVIGELSIKNRSNTWPSDNYTSLQNVNHDITTREVIVLNTHTLREYDYNEYKRRVGYKENYIPRGTIRARPLPS